MWLFINTILELHRSSDINYQTLIDLGLFEPRVDAYRVIRVLTVKSTDYHLLLGGWLFTIVHPQTLSTRFRKSSVGITASSQDHRVQIPSANCPLSSMIYVVKAASTAVCDQATTNIKVIMVPWLGKACHMTTSALKVRTLNSEIFWDICFRFISLAPVQRWHLKYTHTHIYLSLSLSFSLYIHTIYIYIYTHIISVYIYIHISVRVYVHI